MIKTVNIINKTLELLGVTLAGPTQTIHSHDKWGRYYGSDTSLLLL